MYKDINDEERVEDNHYSHQLVNSEYNVYQVRDIIIIISSISGNRKRKRELEEKKRNYRSDKESLYSRLRKRLLEFTNWFKDDAQSCVSEEEERDRETKKELLKYKKATCLNSPDKIGLNIHFIYLDKPNRYIK